MNKHQVLDHIRRVGLIPVLRTSTAEDALAIAQVLAQAGVTTLEVPLTVPGAVEVIAELVRRFGNDVVVGAGTVLDEAAAAASVAAGARFIISPSLEITVIQYCHEAKVAVMPGALTPTEIVAASRAGADMVKVFPCSAVGGASYLKAVKAPLPDIEMVPTGGVSLETAAAFIKAGAAALGVGGDLVDIAALRGGRAQVIAERALQYLEIVRKTRASSAPAGAG
jgi:2-dehydro-3-deoxyphosphogluconate aldolase/(4S)-4-hydroxy-2-oxoglutarate aldolase